MSTKKSKILMLHGFAMNANAFYSKTTQLRRLLESHNYDLVYADGPIVLQQANDYDTSNYGIQLRTWWITEAPPGSSDSSSESSGSSGSSVWSNSSKSSVGSRTSIKKLDLKPAIDHIRKIIREQGPFDGIIGFSQGSCFAQTIANNMEALGNTKPIKFVIFFSGFMAEERMVLGDEDSQERDDYYATLSKKILFPEPLKVPSLLVIGELDTVVSNERSLDFISRYTRPGTNTIIKHKGAHFFPAQRKIVQQISLWIANNAVKTA